jgi:hypothetical protein
VNWESVISIIAILISISTAYFNIFHRGTVKMIRPQFFALLPEESPFGGCLKFFVRTLLFSTGKRGRVIESIFLDLKQDGKTISFHYWMYGELEQLKIGSGLFVGPDGIAANHHFVPTNTLSVRDFSPGKYEMVIRAVLLGDGSPIVLGNVFFELGNEEVSALTISKDKAIFFVWDIENKKYKTRIDVRHSKSRSVSVSGSGHGFFSCDLS